MPPPEACGRAGTFKGLDYDTIAAMLSMSVGTMKTNAFRGKLPQPGATGFRWTRRQRPR